MFFSSVFVCVVSNDWLQFCHDQVHSAAYECLSVEEREAFHLQLARVMLNLYTPEELSKNLFDLVSHLSRASSKMAAAELRRVVELFKRAAGAFHGPFIHIFIT